MGPPGRLLSQARLADGKEVVDALQQLAQTAADDLVVVEEVGRDGYRWCNVDAPDSFENGPDP
jgi:hypothetical protein